MPFNMVPLWIGHTIWKFRETEILVWPFPFFQHHLATFTFAQLWEWYYDIIRDCVKGTNPIVVLMMMIILLKIITPSPMIKHPQTYICLSTSSVLCPRFPQYNLKHPELLLWLSISWYALLVCTRYSRDDLTDQVGRRLWYCLFQVCGYIQGLKKRGGKT